MTRSVNHNQVRLGALSVLGNLLDEAEVVGGVIAHSNAVTTDVLTISFGEEDKILAFQPTSSTPFRYKTVWTERLMARSFQVDRDDILVFEGSARTHNCGTWYTHRSWQLFAVRKALWKSHKDVLVVRGRLEKYEINFSALWTLKWHQDVK